MIPWSSEATGSFLTFSLWCSICRLWAPAPCPSEPPAYFAKLCWSPGPHSALPDGFNLEFYLVSHPSSTFGSDLLQRDLIILLPLTRDPGQETGQLCLVRAVGEQHSQQPDHIFLRQIQGLLDTFNEGWGPRTDLIWFSDPGWTDLYWVAPANLHRSFWRWKHPLIMLSIFGRAGCWPGVHLSLAGAASSLDHRSSPLLTLILGQSRGQLAMS